MIELHEFVLVGAGICSMIATILSSYLITMHQLNMTRMNIQPKIVGIIWMVPIYAVCSWLSLFTAEYAFVINMVRDCYESYVLYLFLALMLAYMDNDDDNFGTITYLETGPSIYWPCPVNLVFREELPRGKAFLRLCKFGTLQYCIVRPLTTILAVGFASMGVYEEMNFSPTNSYLYMTLLINASVFYAFIILATFYAALKYKMKPYQPVGKFLCIKFVIFFAFWQGMVIGLLIKFGLIKDIDDYYSAEVLGTGLQDTLICIEMVFVAYAHLYTFSYKPFTPEGLVASDYFSVQMADDMDPILESGPKPYSKSRGRKQFKSSSKAMYSPSKRGPDGASKYPEGDRRNSSSERRKSSSGRSRRRSSGTYVVNGITYSKKGGHITAGRSIDMGSENGRGRADSNQTDDSSPGSDMTAQTHSRGTLGSAIANVFQTTSSYNAPAYIDNEMRVPILNAGDADSMYSDDGSSDQTSSPSTSPNVNTGHVKSAPMKSPPSTTSASKVRAAGVRVLPLPNGVNTGRPGLADGQRPSAAAGVGSVSLVEYSRGLGTPNVKETSNKATVQTISEERNGTGTGNASGSAGKNGAKVNGRSGSSENKSLAKSSKVQLISSKLTANITAANAVGKVSAGRSNPMTGDVNARTHAIIPGGDANASAGGSGVGVDTHFASDTALRDFNEAGFDIVLPSNFTAKRGTVIQSDPAQRLRDNGV